MANPTTIMLKDAESHFLNGTANEARFYNESLSEIVNICKATDTLGEMGDNSHIKVYSDMETLMANVKSPEDSIDHYRDENDGFIVFSNVTCDAGHFTMDVLFKA